MAVHIENMLTDSYGEFLADGCEFRVLVKCGKCQIQSRHENWYDHEIHKCPNCSAVVLEVK